MKKTILFVIFSIFLSGAPARAAVTKEATNTRDAYAPLEEFLLITPSDVTTYNPPMRACYVSATTGGAVLTITPVKNASSVSITVIDGGWIPVMASKINASTTATVVCGR